MINDVNKGVLLAWDGKYWHYQQAIDPNILSSAVNALRELAQSCKSLKNLQHSAELSRMKPIHYLRSIALLTRLYVDILEKEYGAYGEPLQLIDEWSTRFWLGELTNSSDHTWGRRGLEQLYSATIIAERTLQRIRNEERAVTDHDLSNIWVNLFPAWRNLEKEYELHYKLKKA